MCHTNCIFPQRATSVYFYLLGKNTYSFSHTCGIVEICVTTTELCVFLRRLRLTHFLFEGEIKMKSDADMYQKMYSKLFNVITDVIELCEDENAIYLLKKAQNETEEIYMTYYE